MEEQQKELTGLESPRFRDGRPDNLAAAALDALDWLELLSRMKLVLVGDNRERLKGCIDALRAFIPEGEPIFMKAEE